MLRFLNKVGTRKHLPNTNLTVYSTNIAIKQPKDNAATDKTRKSRKSDQSFRDVLVKTTKLTEMHPRQSVKKPARPPFVKNIFLGKFDTEMLTFPEALNKEGVECLDREVKPVDVLYSELNESLSKSEFLDRAKGLKLNALHASHLSGGRELNVTEACRFHESLGKQTGDIQRMFNENLGVQSLLKFGSQQQMDKYMKGIVEGKIVVAFAVSEEQGCSTDSMNTCATFNPNSNHWIINGKKFHVVNGHSANVFIVLANTRTDSRGAIQISAFLVDRISGGISTKTAETVGLTGTEIAEVSFEDTNVPKENLLEGENCGLQIYAALLPELQLSQAATCSALSRSAFNQFTAYCKDTHPTHSNFVPTDLLSSLISKYAINIYVMESMTYLTAGLLDIYDNPDCEAECNIVKCFSTQETANMTASIVQYLSSPAMDPNHWAMQLHRDALGHLLLHESIDSLKIVIALQGLKYAGIEMQEIIKKVRNPFHHTADIVKRLWYRRRQRNDHPALILHLGEYLHPSAGLGAEWLEYSVLRMEYVSEMLLAHHGNEVINRHLDLIRLADCIIDIYGMTAALGRASRSYCIGLANSDCEMVMAQTFCHQAMNRIRQRVQQMENGPYVNQEAVLNQISERIFHHGKYFPEHPLARNF